MTIGINKNMFDRLSGKMLCHKQKHLRIVQKVDRKKILFLMKWNMFIIENKMQYTVYAFIFKTSTDSREI